MSEQEDKTPEEAPDGMVRRTRKVRKKRRSKQSDKESKANADTLFAKAKDILVGMEEEDDDYGHVTVAEQVRRLKERKEDDRPLDEVWGTKKRSTTWLWIVLAGMIVSVVAIMFGVTRWLSDDLKEEKVIVDASIGRVDQYDLSEGPLGWFDEQSVEVLAGVRDIIAQANDAMEPMDFVGFVRDSPDGSIDRLSAEQWGADYLTNATSGFFWQSKVVNSSEGRGGAERGYLKVSGRRVDGNPYQAYFIQVGDKLTLDWDATIGWSEMSVADIAREKPSKDIFLRCRVSKKSVFDQKFGEVKHSGYVLSGENRDDFFLAYVPLAKEGNKATDRGLRLLLNYGSFTTDQPPHINQKATLRVRYNKKIGTDGAFEIVEFLNNGWVRP